MLFPRVSEGFVRRRSWRRGWTLMTASGRRLVGAGTRAGSGKRWESAAAVRNCAKGGEVKRWAREERAGEEREGGQVIRLAG